MNTNTHIVLAAGLYHLHRRVVIAGGRRGRAAYRFETFQPIDVVLCVRISSARNSRHPYGVSYGDVRYAQRRGASGEYGVAVIRLYTRLYIYIRYVIVICETRPRGGWCAQSNEAIRLPEIPTPPRGQTLR